MKRLNQQTGISLVEILVALVISLFLLGGIVQVYTGNRATFTFTNALAEIQENGRYALDTMSQDLRLAGKWGCIDVDLDDPDPDNVNDTLDGGTVPGFDANVHDFTGTDTLGGTNDAGLNGSDTMIIRGGKPGQANVESPFQLATSNQLITDAINTIAVDDIVLVARCGANDLIIDAEADLFRVTSSTPITGNTQRQLTFSDTKSQQYSNDAILIEMQTITYTIAAGASGEPALFRQEFSAAAQELIEGVENMQILYGVDSDGDEFANQYMPSNAVVDFDDVVSVRLMLLIRSVDAFVTEAPQTYTFNGVTITPADNRLRQVFTATVALRNRIGDL